MTLHHKTSTMRKYIKANKSDKKDSRCPFCKPEVQATAVRTTDTLFIMPNRVPYEFFEGIYVEDHLMVITKEHRELLADFTKKEREELFDISADYEKQGYHVFARGSGATSRSVQHQHTHLIKLTKRRAKFMLHIEHGQILLAK